MENINNISFLTYQKSIFLSFILSHLENKDIIKDNLLNETWCDLINKNSPPNNLYKDSVYAVTGCSLDEIDKRLEEFKIKNKFKENMLRCG